MTTRAGESDQLQRRLTLRVRHYKRVYRPGNRADKRFIRTQPNLKSAIRVVANARLEDGSKHPHFERRGAVTLRQVERRMLALRADIRACENFHQLLGAVEIAWPTSRMWGPLRSMIAPSDSDNS